MAQQQQDKRESASAEADGPAPACVDASPSNSNSHLPPTSKASTSSAGTDDEHEQPQSSSSPPPQSSPLLTTLNRLSLSTSRPNLPPPESYATRTMRTVSNSLTSLGVWSEGDKTAVSDSSTSTLDAPRDDSYPPLPAGIMRRASSSFDTTSILYPTLENHPAPLAHPLLVLDLAALTQVPVSISNEELLATLLRRLEPWVGEEGEGGYCLIVLSAEDPDVKGRTRTLPGVGWWIWHWRRIPRKYRKNLKRLYIVHPSAMTRTVLPILIPLVSPKSYAKLHTVPSLLGLARRGVSLAGIDVPFVTLNEEARVLRDHPDAANGHAATNLAVHGAPSSPTTWWGSMTSYLPWGHTEPSPPTPVDEFSNKLDNMIQKASKDPETPYWSRDIDEIMAKNADRLPRAMRDLGAVIIKYCANTEGVFRRSPFTGLSTAIRAFLNLPLSRQPRIDWAAIAAVDPLLPPIVYKRLLTSLSAPIIPPNMYPQIRRSHTPEDIQSYIIPYLTPARAAVLDHTVHIAHHLLPHEPKTRMNARALAIVLAPALISGDPREDAVLCMEPGRTLPASLLSGMDSLNALMVDSDSDDPDIDTDASDLSSEGISSRVRRSQGPSQPQVSGPAPNTLVGVLETYITYYALIHGTGHGKSKETAECECGFPNTGAHTPISRPPASPRKGHWHLPGSTLAPPVES